MGASVASTCGDCEAGKYSEDSGSSVCTGSLCEAGKYAPYGIGSNSSAATTCTNCIQGKYSEVGATTCGCAAGKYQTTAGVESASTCADCGAGSYSKAGALTCTKCEVGKYGGGAVRRATVTCSGSCSCPSAAAAATGSITDGIGSYSNGEDCSWVISSVGRSISISFSQFETEWRSDEVVIYSCSSSNSATSCESSSELATISGSSISSSKNWTSTTGYMRVRFTSDSSDTYAGFFGNWSTETCVLCPVGKSSAVVGANNDTTCALCGAGAYPGDSDGVYVGAGASVCSDCCKQDFAVADEFDKISSSYRFGKYDADADGR